VNQAAYPNIRKVVRATDVLLGWVFIVVKVLSVAVGSIVALAVLG